VIAKLSSRQQKSSYKEMTLVNQLLIVLLFCSAIIPNQHVSSLAIENEPIIPPAFECPTQNGVYFYAAGPCLPYYYMCVNGNPKTEVK